MEGNRRRARPIKGGNVMEIRDSFPSTIPPADRPSGEMTGQGKLIFQVSTAGGAIPLGGAEVTLRIHRPPDGGEGGDTVAVLYTNADGKTELVSLPAPAKSLSLAPAQDGSPTPYALYDADIRMAGFGRQSYFRIPVFDGITSIQHAALIPLPENGVPDGVRSDGEQFYEGEDPRL